jgi:uncharacterized protein (TIGR03435 family)
MNATWKHRLVVLLFGMSLSRAQTFDVATFKLSPPPEGDKIFINTGRALNGRVDFSNASLADCIKFAYGISSDAQLAGPDWAKSKDWRYDIVGQAPHDTPRETLQIMVQKLLAERLKLVLHNEQRVLPYLALSAGKAPLKIQPSKDPTAQPPGFFVAGRIVSPAMSMSNLALLLSRFERQTILDRTELKGMYDVHLEWVPESLRNLPARPDGAPILFNGEPVDSRPSLSTAVQEQLGLKLETRKGPIEVLVVDSVEKTPAAN